MRILAKEANCVHCCSINTQKFVCMVWGYSIYHWFKYHYSVSTLNYLISYEFCNVNHLNWWQLLPLEMYVNEGLNAGNILECSYSRSFITLREIFVWDCGLFVTLTIWANGIKHIVYICTNKKSSRFHYPRRVHSRQCGGGHSECICLSVCLSAL